MDGGIALFDWYWEMPIVTRTYFTAAFITTTLCALDVVSVYHLYLNPRAVAQGEVSAASLGRVGAEPGMS